MNSLLAALGRLRKFILLVIILAIFSTLFLYQVQIDGIMTFYELKGTMVISPGEFINFFVISGFSGLAADILWIQSDAYFHAGQWQRMYPLLRMITWLQPHFIENWCTAGWHLAYNMYYHAREDPEMQMAFLQQGIGLLKEGIFTNPQAYKIYETLAWTYYHKLEDYENAAKYFKAALRIPHPSKIERMLAHMYRLQEDYEAEYKQWKRCLTIYTDEYEHIKTTKKYLKRVEKKLGLR